MIPLLDLKAHYAALRPEIEPAVLSVLASGNYVLGEQVQQFERDFAAYCGTRHAIAVNSGTSALHLALLAAGVGPGDEVITSPLTFVATASAIVYAGAQPVFVDVDPETLTLDPKRLEEAVTRRTKAIIPVHLHGQMADMGPILDRASHSHLHVIEDACQAHGAEYGGQRAGSMGVSGCFSFYPGKNLGACGEGGLVVTNDDRQMEIMRMLRDWGQEQRYHHALKGFNYRMDAVQGAILRVKLAHLEEWIAARRARAADYDRLLSGIPHLRLPVEAPGRRHVYHVYAVRTPERDDLRRHLEREGIQTGLHYPIPVHLQKAFRDLGYAEGDFPVAEAACREVLSLPIYPELAADQVENVAEAIMRDVYA
ncbi:DegT/DnrJ/EryC1/StrS family aminotransferase [Lutibaculum baratangense]|uniref:UDP-4-amino-4-deoxy-L-arabinose--oxoglutarate aminotransferase n=1 Tax=Lutibaculum baratangense AMV1 TaxID=631454 RepID=V4RA52_9HYPH|nr:DegT/DnrJ/EryC1/StrS family aminotransferase [Lutibaculum baratangense]ESR23046.1 UDP-4-amino-4-deoxy-L-arabinose--oxoglutarate aminotransferase [Lutibaculum baratangense AMV1]